MTQENESIQSGVEWTLNNKSETFTSVRKFIHDNVVLINESTTCE